MNFSRSLLSVLLLSASSLAQTAPTAAPVQQTKPSSVQPARPLQLQSLDPGARPDPFPPLNKKYFTADTPSVATVDSYLHAMLGYDANRIWRVAAIQKTAVPGVSKVTAFISDKGAGAKVQSAAFVVLADGNTLLLIPVCSRLEPIPLPRIAQCCNSGRPVRRTARSRRTCCWLNLQTCSAPIARTHSRSWRGWPRLSDRTNRI